MYLIKTLAVCAVLMSGFATANQMEISSQKLTVSKSDKTQTYSGDVRIAFLKDMPLETKADLVRIENGKTIMQGKVEIKLNNAIAMTEKVSFLDSKEGLIAEMDEVTFTFK